MSLPDPALWRRATVTSSFSLPANKGTAFPFTLLLCPLKSYISSPASDFLTSLSTFFWFLCRPPWEQVCCTVSQPLQLCVSIPVKPGVYSLDWTPPSTSFLVNDNNARALGNFFPARTPGCLWAPIWPLISFLCRLFNESLKPVEIPFLKIHFLNLTTFPPLLIALTLIGWACWSQGTLLFSYSCRPNPYPLHENPKLEETQGFPFHKLENGFTVATL